MIDFIGLKLICLKIHFYVYAICCCSHWPASLIDTLEHGTVVVVVIGGQALSTVDCHDLTCAEAGVIGGQVEKSFSDLSRGVQLAG